MIFLHCISSILVVLLITKLSCPVFVVLKDISCLITVVVFVTGI